MKVMFDTNVYISYIRKSLLKQASFVNDVHIAFTALSIGAALYTENKDHFEIIVNRLQSLRVTYL